MTKRNVIFAATCLVVTLIAAVGSVSAHDIETCRKVAGEIYLEWSRHNSEDSLLEIDISPVLLEFADKLCERLDEIAEPDETEDSPKTEILYAQATANIRQLPRTNADKAGRLSRGEKIEVSVEITEGGDWPGHGNEWRELESGGYVHNDLLSDTPPAVPIAPAAVAVPVQNEQPANNQCVDVYNQVACVRVAYVGGEGCHANINISGADRSSQGHALHSAHGCKTVNDPFGGGGRLNRIIYQDNGDVVVEIVKG